MQLPIPNDWDGDDWLCVQVAWPNSPQYLAILRGLLTMLTRGRLYDANTGTITEAQRVGWQVWDKNWPFTLCCGEKGTDIPADNGNAVFGAVFEALGGGIDELENEQMGVLTLKWDKRGRLWMRLSPCCDWELVPIGEAPGIEELDEQLPGTDPGSDEVLDVPPGKNYACIKSHMLAEMLYSIAETVLNTVINQAPGNWSAALSSAYPGFTFSKWYRAACFLQASAMQVADYVSWFEANLPEHMMQMLICRMYPQMQNTPGLTSDEQRAFKAAIQGAFEGDTQNLLIGVYNMVADDNWVDVALMSLNATGDYNCDCPSVIVEPSDYAGVYFVAGSESNVPENVEVDIKPTHVDFTVHWAEGAYKSFDNLRWDLSIPSGVQTYTVACFPLSGVMVTEPWTSTEDIGSSQFARPELRTNPDNNLKTATLYPVPGVLQSQWSPGTTEDVVWSHNLSARRAGTDAGNSLPAATQKFTVRIIEVNGVFYN